jgi:hypothetical protein
MLEIFYEKKDFFLLKEMEKIAPREKGKNLKKNLKSYPLVTAVGLRNSGLFSN